MSSETVDRALIYVAMSIAAIIVFVMVWGIVEATINFFRKRERRVIVFYGHDVLGEKLDAALKGKKDIGSSIGKWRKYIRDGRDSDGRLIPIEYRASFNRFSWCWPGFFFPILWSFAKGLNVNGLKYLIARVALFFVSMVMSRLSEDFTFPLEVLSIVLPGIWCGLEGYRAYSASVNVRTPQEIKLHRIIGIVCFWLVILLGYYIWLTSFRPVDYALTHFFYPEIRIR